MLKTISSRDLCMGMYVHEVPGSWLDHPFWRGSFLIEKESQLEQLACVKEVIIDTSKGLSQASVVVDDVDLPEASSADLKNLPKVPAEPAALPAKTGFAEELVHAEKVLQSSVGAMREIFRDVRMGNAVDAEHCLPLVKDIAASVERNPAALISLARLKTSDDYTFMHSVAVCALMVALARQLGLDGHAIREAGMAGLVHDMGKALMPLSVLNKPGALTSAEFDVMKQHPHAGYELLKRSGGVGDVALDVCLHHHEKLNGKGYPKGLKGDEISLYAKMGAVCDVYDAITSNRPYKAGWDPADSLAKMAAWTNEGHFDLKVFQAFVKSIGIYPTGSLVRLRSGRLAVVIEQSTASLLTPIVRVFYSTKSQEPIPVERIDLSKHIDEIVSRESNRDWGFKHLDQLWHPEEMQAAHA